MQNVKNKLEKLEKIQRVINDKINKVQFNNNKNEYSIYQEKEKLQLDIDLKNMLLNTENNINTNYSKFYESIKNKKIQSSKKFFHNENKVVNTNSNNRLNNKIIKPIDEKAVEIDNMNSNYFFTQSHPMIVSFENNFEINQQEKTKEEEKVFVSNQLVNLRLKLEKIKTKNNLFKTLLKNGQVIKNCKLIDKLISGFIEKLIIHWDEIVDMILNDLITEEIINLNEMEIGKLEDVDKIPKCVNDDKKMSQNEDNNNNTINKDSLFEINKMISDYKKEENYIINKYLNKNSI